MIDFRYHLVSIVAIFLALSVGIVLGTTLLKEPAIDTAETLANQLRLSNTELRAELKTVQGRNAANDAFITADTSRLVRDALAGERVVIVEAPGGSVGTREAVQQVITASGATVSGRVTLTDKYIDTAQSLFVDKLATDAKPVDLTFLAEDTPYDKAAAVLANAIVTGDPAQVGKTNTVAAGVLDAFQRGGLITFTEQPAKRADLVVLIAPAEPYTGDDAVTQAGAIVSLATGLDEAGRGTVLAGAPSSSAAGGAVAALRDDAVAVEKVSSVDNADMPAGRVVVVYALREQLSGASGQYGMGPGVSGIEPSASPTPTATSGG
ncbi:copper transporter [Streptosporangium sp. NPDC051022]|uniref:copper transporter n=1 Tax=Streptosporangium sp. NPDC051022 TaxID=3155752 RepID=UPI00342CD9AC